MELKACVLFMPHLHIRICDSPHHLHEHSQVAVAMRMNHLHMRMNIHMFVLVCKPNHFWFVKTFARLLTHVRKTASRASAANDEARDEVHHEASR